MKKREMPPSIANGKKTVAVRGPCPVLARLEPGELRSILQAQEAIQQHARDHQLLVDGMNGRWAMLMCKYGLPREFDLDMKTGAITVKG